MHGDLSRPGFPDRWDSPARDEGATGGEPPIRYRRRRRSTPVPVRPTAPPAARVIRLEAGGDSVSGEREIATVIGKRLNLPVVAKNRD